MDKLKYSIFDLFSYTLPGAFVLSSIILINYSKDFCCEEFILIDFIKENLNIYSSILFIIGSYLSGFITNFFGSYYLKFFMLISPVPEPKYSKLSNSEKYVLIREFSPINFEYVEKWNSLKAMCSNFAMVILLSSIFLFLLVSCFSYLHLILGSLISIISLLISRRFHKWSIIDLDNTIHLFNLDTHSKTFFSNQK